MKNYSLIILTIAFAGCLSLLKAQNVNIPDANFKASLVNNSAINTNGDAEIQLSEAAQYNGAINVDSLQINTLVGIQYFMNITSLDCSHNQLQGINVSANTSLHYLNCSHNQIAISTSVFNNTGLDTLICSNNPHQSISISNSVGLLYLDCSNSSLVNLDVSTNVNLKKIICHSNQISSLNLNNNNQLTYLDCNMNDIQSLDFSNNPLFIFINCSENYLSSLNVLACNGLTILYCAKNIYLTNLDVTNNVNLLSLSCFENQLTSLNVSSNTQLLKLSCGWNQLTTLDVSNNPLLTEIDCHLNHLTDLNISNNPAINKLICSYNQLYSLNVKNNNNANFISFYSKQNPNLTCIEVDDTTYSKANWISYKDSISVFSTNCLTTNLTHNLNTTELKIVVKPNPTTITLNIQTTKSNNSNVKIYDAIGQLYLDEKLTNQNTSLNIQHLQSGIYFIKVDDTVQKFVKE